MQVFRALLAALEPQQRFGVAARVTSDVLTAVVDEVLPLTKPVRAPYHRRTCARTSTREHAHTHTPGLC